MTKQHSVRAVGSRLVAMFSQAEFCNPLELGALDVGTGAGADGLVEEEVFADGRLEGDDVGGLDAVSVAGAIVVRFGLAVGGNVGDCEGEGVIGAELTDPLTVGNAVS